MHGETAMHSTKFRYMLIFLTTVVIVTVHHAQKYLFRPRLETLVYYNNNIFSDARDPEVSCHFPILHPFHPTILQHVRVADPIRCFERSYLLTMIDKNGFLVYNETALAEAGYDKSSISCTYQEIFRPLNNDFTVNYGPEIKITGHDVPKTDFIYVQCKNFAVVIYRNFHAYVRRSPSVRNFQNDKEIGVAVIGLDSMSRLNFMRQLAQSYKYITEEVNGTVMLGFNKVGENTFPNVIPMLTGFPAPNSNYESFKDWPFIWNSYADVGAATMYSEDLPEFNMFDYLYTGIPEQPTLHYMRTYWLAVEDSMLYKMSSAFCLGPQPKHIIFFNYLKSFLHVYRDSPLFLFSLFNEASHDYVNSVGAIDEDFLSFLKSSFEDNLFNRTVTIVLGDHGNRIDRIRNTDVGRIEDMMPMVTVILPPWINRVYPKWHPVLQENRKRLVSTYDLHATFQHVLTLLHGGNKVLHKDLSKNRMSDRLKKHFSGNAKGISFFTEVPKTRNCKDVGVPDWFCVCQSDEEKLDDDDPRSIGAAKAVVNHFNTVLLDGLLSQCAVQKLDSVERASLTVKEENSVKYKILVRFRTVPGDGVFEATVEASSNNDNENLNYKVSGDIFRINRYGSQADCLSKNLRANSTILRGVCYCL
ncbi:uncharacterized protein LOC142329898 [Lycorma delicatula]|uniref:uncharacterized protein LOC142329898 n=1 Tax=Lycorma delicatula TaxID=130591 RepID=UPI003F50D564